MAIEEDGGYRGGPVFFLSYARAKTRSSLAAPQDVDGHVLRLFDDLTRHVDQLVGPPTGVDPGFLDRALEGGATWAPEVLTAARTCQVFVPLISTGYIGSRWCAMEWDAFARRPVVRRPGVHTLRATTAILPVMWSPVPEGRLPSMIRSLQFFEPHQLIDPGITRRYGDDGIYGLLTLQDEVAYQSVAWRLARRISDVFHEYRVVEQPGPGDTSGLRTSFVDDAEHEERGDVG